MMMIIIHRDHDPDDDDRDHDRDDRDDDRDEDDDGDDESCLLFLCKEVEVSNFSKKHPKTILFTRVLEGPQT